MKNTLRIAVVTDAASYFGRECLLGIARFARESPHWTFHLHPRWPTVWRLDLARWHGDAVIAQVADQPLAQALSKLSMPVVNVSSVLPNPPFASVIPDNIQAGRIGAEHLLEMHHTNFGYLGFTGYAYARDIGRGFARRLALAGFKCSVNAPSAGPGDSSQWSRDFVAMSNWVKSLPKPVAILACNDVRARHLLTVCGRIGLRVPEDVALVGVGNDRLTCEFVNPRLSSVALGPERLGYAAAKLAARLMRGRPAPKKPLLIAPLGLTVRQSSSLFAVSDPLLSEALRFIRDHAHELIQVPDVLRAVAVSRRLLERRFQESLGHSPGEEIRRTRLALARQMLADSDQPIYAIAAACGFSGPARLNEAFRRDAGASPTEYRRQSRDAPSS